MNLSAENGAEICGLAGFDWVLIDAEHGPFDVSAIQSQLRVLAGTPTPACVRLPSHDDWVLKQVLDIGAQSILVPMVNTANQAHAIVSACRYAPKGHRGLGATVARVSRFGQVRDYVATANKDVLVMLQVETREAIKNIDAIAAVEGADVIFIGPSDLSADMGLGGDPEAPEVLEALERTVERIHAAGKVSGTITMTPDLVVRFKAMGMGFIGVGSDTIALSQALATLSQFAQDA